MAARGSLGDYTVEQRVLLHLFEHPMQRSQWEGKKEQTQSGISSVICIARKHLPRTLKSLMKQELVDVETRHIIGAKQRCRVYFLTHRGKEAAEAMRTTLGEKIISTKEGEITISKLAGHDLSYLFVLAHLDKLGNYDPTMYDENKLEESLDVQLYRKVLHRAWGDGKLTADERNMLDDISIHLGLEPDVVESIETEVKSERVDSSDEQIQTFIEVLSVAWQDGFISEDEQSMLNSLAHSLHIPADKAEIVQSEWISKNC
ncbi:MAG: TerB family tellurite resistance protein [Euryarchaeota archaeon]|nr:TerB family tellurite resistance protein [Euryarchaeota archaeon]